MHDLTATRNMLGAFLLFLAVPFAFNACGDTDNVTNPESPAPPPPPPPPPPLVLKTGTPITGTVGKAFSFLLKAEGGTPPYTWSIDGPPLTSPAPGLLLNSNTGGISGTPNTPGLFTLTYRVTDTADKETPKSLTIAIGEASSTSGTGLTSIADGLQASPSITPFTLPNGTVNVAYLPIQLEATGGTPPYTWSVSPALPNGLFLNVLGLGIISGTPLNATTGSTTYTVTVMDSSAPTGQSSRLTRNLTVNAALTIDAGSPTGPPLPAGTVGQPYHTRLSASGATGPGTYTWSIVGNLLPASGLQPLSSDGVMSGTPNTPGSFTRTYRVQNDLGVAVTKSLTLNVNAVLSIDTDNTTLPLPLGNANQPYGPATVTASGGTPPYTWSVTPALPGSLTLNDITGEMTGTLDAGRVGTTTHMFTVQDSASQSIKKSVHLIINP